MHSYQGSHLRKGRVSLANQVYHVTTVTRSRQPIFNDFALARGLVHSLEFAHTQAWADTLAFVVMPDHLHWLLQLHDVKDLSSLVSAIKRHGSRLAGKSIWQAGFHDHGVRRDEDLKAMARYIIANPVRAGLVERVGDYPHWDAVWL